MKAAAAGGSGCHLPLFPPTQPSDNLSLSSGASSSADSALVGAGGGNIGSSVEWQLDSGSPTSLSYVEGSPLHQHSQLMRYAKATGMLAESTDEEEDDEIVPGGDVVEDSDGGGDEDPTGQSPDSETATAVNCGVVTELIEA